MWSCQSQSGSDYLFAVLPGNGQELNSVPTGSNNRPMNQAGSQAPNATWSGFNGRSLTPAGLHAPNQTLTVPKSRTLSLAGGQAINQTYGMPVMAIAVPSDCPFILTVDQGSDYSTLGPYARPLYQYSGQPTYGTASYHYQPYPYPYQNPVYASGNFSYPPEYTYPHQYQPITYPCPCQYSTYPDYSYENSRYAGPAPFSSYAEVKNEYPGYPSPRQSSQLGEYVETEVVQSSPPSTEDPPVVVMRSFDCAFCRFRAENESVFRNHNHSCKGPRKEKVKYEAKPSKAK